MDISYCCPLNQQQLHPSITMKFLVFAVLIAVAVADNAYPEYPATYDKPSYDYAPKPYSYSYAVKDEASYNDYLHSESSDGKVVTGSYSVALPDGRTQVVTYKADSYGYVADVKYIGEAKYPEYRPASYSPSYESPAYTSPAYTTVYPDSSY